MKLKNQVAAGDEGDLVFEFHRVGSWVW